jgi:hypothetical protein
MEKLLQKEVCEKEDLLQEGNILRQSLAHQQDEIRSLRVSLWSFISNLWLVSGDPGDFAEKNYGIKC